MIPIKEWPSALKALAASFALLLSLGTAVGLTLVAFTTHSSPKGTIERYNGSQSQTSSDSQGTSSDNQNQDFDSGLAESYPKPMFEMLLTTHNHVIPFSLIFLALGALFFFSSWPQGYLKTFVMVEPFIATLTTFGGLWLMRFVHPSFVWLVIPSSIFLYTSLFFMAAIIVWEALFSKAS